MIVTTIYATEHHAYALPQQAARTTACFNDAGLESGVVIMVTDASKAARAGVAAYQDAMPEGFTLQNIVVDPRVKLETTYSNNQDLTLLIARLQHIAWTAARKLRPTYVWSLESDVMPPHNALTVMKQMLEFDHGYYDVAMVTYPNAGFLGGRATAGHWIAPDIYDDERDIPNELQLAIDGRTERLKELGEKREAPSEDELKTFRDIDDQVKACPQKGNVHTLNGIRWRRRGWLENAYPGCGAGTVLPTDWVGLGCTLMNARAVNAAHFEGYTGAGTQDLWLAHNCWTRMRMCVIPHVVAHHIKRKEDDFELLFAYHEKDGELAGHPRVQPLKWRSIA